MRKRFNQVKEKQDVPQSYDSIDDIYIVDQNIDDGVDIYEQSPNQRIVGRKLVFSEIVVDNTTTPNFNEQYNSNYSGLSETDKIQQNTIKNIDHQILLNKVINNSLNTTLNKNFSKKNDSSQLQIQRINLSQSTSEKQSYLCSSDRQIQSMKQEIKNNHLHNQIQEQNNIQINSVKNQKNYKQQANSPTAKPQIKQIDEQEIKEINILKNKKKNISEQQIEDTVLQNLNQRYDKLCSKIQNTKVEMYNKNKQLKDICKHEQTKYFSLYQRSSEMTERVHMISQNN